MNDWEFLLDVLADGEWHNLNEILRRSFDKRGCGLTVHSRAATLRNLGYTVEHRTVGRAKRGAGSEYRLVGSLGEKDAHVHSGTGDTGATTRAPASFSPSEQLTFEQFRHLEQAEMRRLPRRGAYTEDAA